MKRIILIFTLLLVGFSFILSAKYDIHFNRGIAYLLLEDMDSAAKHFALFFQNFQNPTIPNFQDRLLKIPVVIKLGIILY